MGCGSSREAHPEPSGLPTSHNSHSNRNADSANADSRTAINHPLSNSASTTRYQSSTRISHARQSRSASDLSVQADEVALNDAYNAPLLAPNPWSSTNRSWSYAQLARERDDFFETRVTGRPEIWGALKEVTQLVRQGDLNEAQGILDAAGITLPTGRLEEGAYDERGVLYRLPENIVSDPKNVITEDGMTGDLFGKNLEAGDSTTTITALANDPSAKGKNVVEESAMKIRCRLSDRGGPDIIVLLGPTQPVSVLVRRLRTEATIPSSSRVRIAYFGRILDESQTLDDQGWQQGHVVQGLVSNFGP